MALVWWELLHSLGRHVPLQLEAEQHKVTRLFAVMTSALVITMAIVTPPFELTLDYWEGPCTAPKPMGTGPEVGY